MAPCGYSGGVIGPCLLVVGAIAAYGVSTFLQSHAAERVPTTGRPDPRLLARLAGQRVYVAGVSCQLVGFILAFFARERLPLFLVQPAVAASLGVTLLLGVACGRWALGKAQALLLLAVGGGLGCLGLAATGSTAERPSAALVLGLALAATLLLALALPACRLSGPIAPAILGGMSGAGFGAAAVAARALTADLSPIALLTSPASYLLVVHLAIGQYLFAVALQRRNVSAATATMYVVTTLSSATVGLLVLNDRWRPGMLPLMIVGAVLALAASLGLARYSGTGQQLYAERGEPAGRLAPSEHAGLSGQEPC